MDAGYSASNLGNKELMLAVKGKSFNGLNFLVASIVILVTVMGEPGVPK